MFGGLTPSVNCRHLERNARVEAAGELSRTAKLRWPVPLDIPKDSRARHASLAGRARLDGIQSVHVATFSQATQYGLWPQADPIRLEASLML